MGEELVRGRAVPVLLAVGRDVHVAGAQLVARLALDWTKPRPSVTYRVWPPSWECHAVRAPGVKCTEIAITPGGASGEAIVSMNTSPENDSAGPLVVGGR